MIWFAIAVSLTILLVAMIIYSLLRRSVERDPKYLPWQTVETLLSKGQGRLILDRPSELTYWVPETVTEVDPILILANTLACPTDCPAEYALDVEGLRRRFPKCNVIVNEMYWSANYL